MSKHRSRKHKPITPKDDFKKRAVKKLTRAAVISCSLFVCGLFAEASYVVISHWLIKASELSLGAVLEFVLFGWE